MPISMMNLFVIALSPTYLQPVSAGASLCHLPAAERSIVYPFVRCAPLPVQVHNFSRLSQLASNITSMYLFRLQRK